MLGDSNDDVPLGTAAARTATTSAAASRSVMFSVVIDPGTDLTGDERGADGRVHLGLRRLSPASSTPAAPSTLTTTS